LTVFSVYGMLRRFPPSLYTSARGMLCKNMFFFMKKDILCISVVSYYWSGMVPFFLLKKQPNFTASMLYKIIVETMTYICFK